jgi:hypothetical protein
LRGLLAAFLDLATNGPENVRRAARHFNAGYSEVRGPTIQIVVWCRSIESLFTREGLGFEESNLQQLIDDAAGLKTEIGKPSRAPGDISSSGSLILPTESGHLYEMVETKYVEKI